MTKQKRTKLTETFWPEMRSAAPVVPTFGAGEVAEVLGLDMWKLQKFLSGKRYQLTPNGEELGRGRGVHRRFKIEEIYRLAIASRMAQDGFAAKFVGDMLGQLYDDDFWDQRDPNDGSELPPLRYLTFVRTTAGPQMRMFSSVEEIPGIGKPGNPYYLLDLSILTSAVNLRLKELAARS